MTIIIEEKAYKWLLSLDLMRSDAEWHRRENGTYEVPYDWQLYLENGYLIGQILAKVYQGEKKPLLWKIRKIATLSQGQNWLILKNILDQMGIYQLHPTQPITESTISSIITQLTDDHAPASIIHKQKRHRKPYIQIQQLKIPKPIQQAENSLQIMCILLMRNLNIQVQEALGLLVDECRYLKVMIVEGSVSEQWEEVIHLFEDVLMEWTDIEAILDDEESSSYHHFLTPLVEGVGSHNKKVVLLTLRLLERVKLDSWFESVGYLKMLESNDQRVFQFLLIHLQPHYEQIFNQSLHEHITQRLNLLNIFTNILQHIRSSIHKRKVLHHMPISYILNLCLQTLNSDTATHVDQRVGLELLTEVLCDYQEEVASVYVAPVCRAYKFRTGRLSREYEKVVMLLHVVEALLKKQSHLIDKFFKLLMEYIIHGTVDMRQLIMTSLTTLYDSMGSYFPLGCFLGLFNCDSLLQGYQYQWWHLLLFSTTTLLHNQLTQILQILTHYYLHQLHCSCVIELIKKAIGEWGEGAREWGESVYPGLLQELEVGKGMRNVPPAPPKNKSFQAVGIKRKEMLELRSYATKRRVLIEVAAIQDRSLLVQFRKALDQVVMRMSKQNEINNIFKKTTKEFFIWLLKMVTNNMATLHNNSESIVKTILMSRSKVAQTPNLYPPIHEESSRQPSQHSENHPTRQQNEQQESQSEHPSPQEELQNEFLELPSDMPGSALLKTPKFLLPFTEEDSQPHVMFIDDTMLQHWQILYIKRTLSTYSHVLESCTNIYLQLVEGKITLKEMLGKLKLNSVNEVDAETLLMKAKLLHLSSDDIVKQWLTQISFLTFEFKRNRRVWISCVQSLMIHLESILPTIPRNSTSILQSVQFKHMLPGSLVDSSSYTVCFQVLSEILQEGFDLPIVQPLPFFVNQVHPTLASKPNLQQTQQEAQLKELQQKLTEQHIEKPLDKKIHLRSKKALPPKQLYARKTPAIPPESNLREKLTKRRKQLEAQLTSKH